MRRLVLFQGDDALHDSASAWRTLEERTHASYFQTHSFARTWFETIGKPCHAGLRVVVAYEGDGPVGLFPATTVRLHGIPVLTWIGVPDAQDCGDVLFDLERDPHGLESFTTEALGLLRRSARFHQPLFLNVPQGGLAARVFDERLLRIERGAIPVLDTSGSYDAFCASLSRSRRSKMSRAVKHLDTAGETVVREAPVSSEEGAALLAELFDMKVRQRAQAKRLKTISFERQLDFCQRQCDQDACGTVFALLLQGTVIAGLFTVTHDSELVGVFTAYDPGHATLSPGMVLQWLMIRRCFEGPAKRFNMGWGCDSYKLHWHPELIELAMYVGKGPAGRLLAFAVRALDRRAAFKDPTEAARRRLRPEGQSAT